MSRCGAFLRALAALCGLRNELADLSPSPRSPGAPAAPDESNVDAFEEALREAIPNRQDHKRTEHVQEDHQEDEATKVHSGPREGPCGSRPEE